MLNVCLSLFDADMLANDQFAGRQTRTVTKLTRLHVLAYCMNLHVVRVGRLVRVCGKRVNLAGVGVGNLKRVSTLKQY